jgi:DNA-binding transcriptional ArsR family regulator
MGSADLLLHPIRLRVVQALLGDARLTTAELRERLDDVPAASLYRHVTTLIEGGIIEVVSERKVRGAVERTLALRTGTARVGADEAREMSVEDHRQAFMTFTAALLGDFERYLERGDVDLARDFAGYVQVGLHLSDEEMGELLTELNAVVAPRLQNQPGPGRTRRILTTIVVPGD